MTAKILPYWYDPMGKQKITVTSAAVVSLTLPTGVVRAIWFTVEDADIRVWMDGTDPTTDTGLRFYKDDFVEISNVKAISQFRAIAIATSAILNIQYFSSG